MSANAPAMNAYGNATRATGTPRSVEYQVFSQVTGRLNRARQADRPFSELAEALHDNLRLWSVIATDITQPDNALPVGLRSQLGGLAKFIRTHTHQVLLREAEAGVLIEINTAVMRGLRGQLPPEGS